MQDGSELHVAGQRCQISFFPGFSMIFNGFPRIFRGFPWVFHGFSMDFRGFSRDFPGFAWISTDFLWISLDFPWILHWFSMGSGAMVMLSRVTIQWQLFYARHRITICGPWPNIYYFLVAKSGHGPRSAQKCKSITRVSTRNCSFLAVQISDSWMGWWAGGLWFVGWVDVWSERTHAKHTLL